MCEPGLVRLFCLVGDEIWSLDLEIDGNKIFVDLLEISKEPLISLYVRSRLNRLKEDFESLAIHHRVHRRIHSSPLWLPLQNDLEIDAVVGFFIAQNFFRVIWIETIPTELNQFASVPLLLLSHHSPLVYDKTLHFFTNKWNLLFNAAILVFDGQNTILGHFWFISLQNLVRSFSMIPSELIL